LGLVGCFAEQQLVVEADGFVDLLVDFLAALNVMRSEPAAHAFVLQVGVEAVGEVLVFAVAAQHGERVGEDGNRQGPQARGARSRGRSKKTRAVPHPASAV
jgi:hypothetical protein